MQYFLRTQIQLQICIPWFIILIALKSQHGNIIDLASSTALSSVYYRATLIHTDRITKRTVFALEGSH